MGLVRQVRHGAHVLTGADPDVDGDGRLALRLRCPAPGPGGRFHRTAASLASVPSTTTWKVSVRHAGLLVGLLHRHAHQLGYGVRVRRRRDKGGEDGPEQEEQDHHDHYGTAADQRESSVPPLRPGAAVRPRSRSSSRRRSRSCGGLPAPAGGAGVRHSRSGASEWAHRSPPAAGRTARSPDSRRDSSGRPPDLRSWRLRRGSASPRSGAMAFMQMSLQLPPGCRD